MIIGLTLMLMQYISHETNNKAFKVSIFSKLHAATNQTGEAYIYKTKAPEQIIPGDYSYMHALAEEVYEALSEKNPEIRKNKLVLGLTIQKNDVGAIGGGMGDITEIVSHYNPEIQAALPLTTQVKKFMKTQPAYLETVAIIPIELADPVTADKYVVNVNVGLYVDSNLNANWFFHSKEFMDFKFKVPDMSNFVGKFETTNNYGGLYGYRIMMGGLTENNKPDLTALHPIVRRYVDQPDLLSRITYGLLSKAMTLVLDTNKEIYKTVWLHDDSFTAIGGEVLLPKYEELKKNLFFVLHNHNILYQGIIPKSPNNNINKIMMWPKKYFTEDYFKMYGQFNFYAGFLNLIKNDYLDGVVSAVSETNALEMTTYERGAGMHNIFRELFQKYKLVGTRNPFLPPPDYMKSFVVNVDEEILEKEDLTDKELQFDKKLEAKLKLQRKNGLKVDKDAFLVLWNHRCIQQKQFSAFMKALERILEERDPQKRINIQFIFHTNIGDIGADVRDIALLKKLKEKYPEHVAINPFIPMVDLVATTGAVDSTIMPSYFEPYGYATMWGAVQGSFAITGGNGGQVDIFDEKSAVLLDITPDVDDKIQRWSLKWALRPWKYPYASKLNHRKNIVQKNSEEIYNKLLESHELFNDPQKHRALQIASIKAVKKQMDPTYFNEQLKTLLYSLRPELNANKTDKNRLSLSKIKDLVPSPSNIREELRLHKKKSCTTFFERLSGVLK